jgi:mono/diheme cytochrome c family protein
MQNIKFYRGIVVMLLSSLPLLPHLAMAISSEEIYQLNCMVCHGSDGSGAMPGVPDFSQQPSALQQTDAQLLDLLKKGVQRPGSSMAMPPNGGNPQLDDEALLNAIRYMRQLISDVDDETTTQKYE